MKNNQKGFVLPLILAIIAVLAIGGGVYYYQKAKTSVPTNTEVTTNNQDQTTNSATTSESKASSQSNTSASDTINTTNWKTYTNAKYGFSFKYPSSYGTVTTLQDGSIAIGQNGNSNIGIYMPHVLLNSNGQPENLTDLTNRYKTQGWTETTQTVGGIKSLGISSSQVGDEILVPLPNNQILTIEGSFRDPLFIQMLTTFKFTK
jgi:hypothetical protein